MKSIVKKVRISKRSILQGDPGEVDSCPIALAVRKALKIGDDQTVMVDGISIDLLDGDGNTTHSMSSPVKVNNFIKRYDRIIDEVDPDTGRQKYFKKNIKPFTFVLKMEKVENNDPYTIGA